MVRLPGAGVAQLVEVALYVYFPGVRPCLMVHMVFPPNEIDASSHTPEASNVTVQSAMPPTDTQFTTIPGLSGAFCEELGKSAGDSVAEAPVQYTPTESINLVFGVFAVKLYSGPPLPPPTSTSGSLQP